MGLLVKSFCLATERGFDHEVGAFPLPAAAAWGGYWAAAAAAGYECDLPKAEHKKERRKMRKRTRKNKRKHIILVSCCGVE